ncbi:MAG: TetR/AcrR family transcriptional regulator [Dehalococcoidia bacterium]|nr:TetR/AcrR family transcriptional regulator [Dehalococcoidia bacterium]MCL4230852.1 TetR/AcrR family transcriptional regulator [Dehalococcoidia bacterium]
MTTRDSEPSRANGRGRGGGRRKSILSAAERLFADRGYARTSMREIAGAVGVTDAALYKHFESKREILEVLYEERGFFRAMDELESLSGKPGFEEQFRRNTIASTGLWEANADFLRVIFTEALIADAMALDAHLELMSRWRRGIERLFLIYAGRGEADPADAPLVARLVVSLSFGAYMDRLLLIRHGPEPVAFADPGFREELANEVVRLIGSFRRPAAR